MKSQPVLLLLLGMPACGVPSPYVTTIGILKPGSTMVVHVASGTLNVYQPASGERRDLFTVSATAAAKATPPPAPTMRARPLGLVVRATGKLDSLLVRVPDGVDLVVQSSDGDVNVTDITGNARIVAARGNVDVKLPGYAQAAVDNGNLSVTMGATHWPGTLHFSTQRGDIELWISAKAAFGVHLHTAQGTLFTDFGLRGSSNGAAETIDGIVNGGAVTAIDAETGAGSIRLLRLVPQP